MQYITAFRQGDAGRHLVRQIARWGAQLADAGRTVFLMEVCGSHTMAISRYGIRGLLPRQIRLLSGPGCPVCVTDAGYIDAAIQLAEQGAILATFGDMMRVPGTDFSLADARSRGADVRVCYAPYDAMAIARDHPEREVVFLGIGFETTMAPVVALVREIERQSVPNLSVLTAFKLVPPALHALLGDPEVRIDAFLCPAHVSAIIGALAYRPIVAQYGVPCVVCGFEPLDILLGIEPAAAMLCAGKPELVNSYSRVVRPQGNVAAQALLDAFLEPTDATWRGLGTIAQSGMRLRNAFAHFDAAVRFDLRETPGTPDPACRCGDVLKGKIAPADCPLFGGACTPLHPVGPCMVSAEGSCAAHHRYGTAEELGP